MNISPFILQGMTNAATADLRKQARPARQVRLSRRARRDGVTKLSEL